MSGDECRNPRCGLGGIECARCDPPAARTCPACETSTCACEECGRPCSEDCEPGCQWQQNAGGPPELADTEPAPVYCNASDGSTCDAGGDGEPCWRCRQDAYESRRNVAAYAAVIAAADRDLHVLEAYGCMIRGRVG